MQRPHLEMKRSQAILSFYLCIFNHEKDGEHLPADALVYSAYVLGLKNATRSPGLKFET